MERRHHWQILLGLLVCLGLLPPGAPHCPTSASAATIESDLLARLAREGSANLFVQMSAQADLAAAEGMDWQARGSYVWDALSRLAGVSQAQVLAYARDHSLDACSLVMTNAVYIRGATLAAAQDLAALPGVAEVRLFSSRGPSCYGAMAKPNLVASGVQICSAYPGDAWSCGYSGTSMSSAYSAGGVALLLSGCPDLVGDFQLMLDTLLADGRSRIADAGSHPACAGRQGGGWRVGSAPREMRGRG